jgi:hypothetical protein
VVVIEGEAAAEVPPTNCKGAPGVDGTAVCCALPAVSADDRRDLLATADCCCCCVKLEKLPFLLLLPPPPAAAGSSALPSLLHCGRCPGWLLLLFSR